MFRNICKITDWILKHVDVSQGFHKCVICISFVFHLCFMRFISIHMCLIGVSTVSHMGFRGVSQVFHVCHQLFISVSYVFHWFHMCFMCVSYVFHRQFDGASYVVHRCFMIFHLYCIGVSQYSLVFHGSFNGVSYVFHRCFICVAQVSHWYSIGIS